MSGDNITVGSARAYKWYFSQGFGNILTIPLFLVLTFMFIKMLGGTLIQLAALIKATWAVYGVVGIIALGATSWLWALLLFGPLIIFFMLITYPAVAWSDLTVSWLRRLGNILLVLVVAFLAVWLLDVISVWLIGWIADGNPCAAWKAGVTGSIPPTNCDEKS
jgi:hypothetical protein